MANHTYTERYVTQAAGGGGDGSSGTPWTLTEAFANAASGDRVNIQSDGAYSIGVTTITNAGSAATGIIYRGYNSAIGDLDTVGRDDPADGSALVTTNMPDITLTGLLTPAADSFTWFMNLNFSGALSSALIGADTIDSFSMYQCKVVNTQNNSAARAVHLNDSCNFVMSDFECSGAAHDDVLSADLDVRVVGCRLKGIASSVAMLNMEGGVVAGSLFIGDGNCHGIEIESVSVMQTIINNTIYNANESIYWTVNAAATGPLPMLVNNHVTDGAATYLRNTYSRNATYEIFSRTRDNTTPRTLIGDGLEVGRVSTDTGDDTTDFKDASNEDFSLISGAPGEDAGLKLG